MAAGFLPAAPDAETKSARLDEMLESTGIPTNSQKELVEKADILLIIMPASRHVGGLMYAEDGIIKNIWPGTVGASNQPLAVVPIAAALLEGIA